MICVQHSLNNPQAIEESFNRDGFAHVESCLSQEELLVAQRQIKRYKREILP